LLLAALAALGPAQPSAAVLPCNNWDNTSGDWQQLGHWSLGHVPTSGEAACITAPGDYTVSVQGTQSAGGLTLGGATGTQTVELDGTIANGNATLTLSDQGNGSDGVLANGVV